MGDAFHCPCLEHENQGGAEEKQFHCLIIFQVSISELYFQMFWGPHCVKLKRQIQKGMTEVQSSQLHLSLLQPPQGVACSDHVLQPWH